MLSRPQRQQTAKTVSVPAPVKGLNAKDSIASMEPDYALVLDNYFCTPTSVNTRNGTAAWATGMPAWVETIAHYVGGSSYKMFSASGAYIYDTTSAGSVGSAKVSGLTSARFQWVNFATPGGNFMYMVNGSDSPLLFDGTNWTKITGSSSPAITGVTTSNLISVNAFQNRLYFIEKNTLHIWFLPLQSIGGAASLFDLSSIMTMGGYLVAMFNWTATTDVSGISEYACFVTSEGEVAVYQGYDPSFAGTFTLVGKFRIGRPIGYRCFTKMGSDNVLITADGFTTLGKELTSDRNQGTSLSYNIVNLVNNDVQAYANNFGWQPVYYPIGNKLIINVPQTENSVQYQYIMNTITGAWSTWNKENNSWNAACWDTFEDNLFYGGDGVVVQADIGENDQGLGIFSDMKPAFSYFGALGQEKYFTMVRPIYVADGTVIPTFTLCLDFDDKKPTALSQSIGNYPPWDTTAWDDAYWGSQGTLVKNWLTVGGVGYAAALRIGLLTQDVQAQLQSIDYVYEGGGVL